MERKISQQVRGYRTKDGAGVSLVRVLGNQTVEEYDPIFMLDSFDIINPDDYSSISARSAETSKYFGQKNAVSAVFREINL